ncbi:MAG: hypothetical protein HGGPFJEG_03056 [Ignavibacteria bacterium]|nr:hypothetical protein [Ignavibacteria bacterium]
MTIGDLKISLFLDVKPLGESIKTSLNLLRMFSTSAGQLMKLQPPTFKAGDIDSEINKLNTTLSKLNSEAEQTSTSTDKLGDSFQKSSTVSFRLNDSLQNLFLRFQGIQTVLQILKNTFSEYLTKFNSYQSALLGLESISVFKGLDKNEAKDVAQNLDLVKNGLLSIADASTAFKNLLAANFTLEQSTEIIRRLGESAAFGRQESLSFGDAVRSATEGIKNGNSILVDNAGVTKNLSIMLEEAGFKAQDLMKAGQDAGIRMAIFNGIIQETNGQLGNADKLMNSSQGGLIRFSKAVDDLKIAFGGIVSTMASVAVTILMPVNKFLLEAPPKMKVAALAIMTVLTAVTLLNGQLSVTTKGFLLINALMIALPTPIKILVGGLALITAGIIAVNGQLVVMNTALGGLPLLIGLVVTGAAAFTSAYSDVSSTVSDINSVMEESNDKIKEQEENLKSLLTVNEALKNGMVLTMQEQENYNAALERVKQVYPEVVSGIDSKTRAESLNEKGLTDLIEKEKEKLKIYTDAATETIAAELANLTEEYVEQSEEVNELNNKLKDGAKILKEEFFFWNLNPFETFEGYLSSASAELLETAKTAEDTQKKIIDLFSTNFKNAPLHQLFKGLSAHLGDSKLAADTLNDAVSVMVSNILTRFKALTSSASILSEAFELLTLAQNLIKVGEQIGAPEVMKKGQDIINKYDELLKKQESIINSLPKSETKKSTSHEAEKEEKKKIDLLEEYNKKLKETEDIIADIQLKLQSPDLRFDERYFLLEQLQKYIDILNEYKRIKIKPGEVEAPDVQINKVDKKKQKKEKAITFDDRLNQGLVSAQRIAEILGLGADTFVSKLINGLSNAVSLVNSIAGLLAAIMGGGGGGGLFGLLRGIFSFGSSGGGASGAAPGRMMPIGGQSNLDKLVERFSAAFQTLSAPQVVQIPYVQNYKLKGNDIEVSLRRTQRIIGNRKK